MAARARDPTHDRALDRGRPQRLERHVLRRRQLPFAGGEHGQIAVKVIDDRGNELLVVRSLEETDR